MSLSTPLIQELEFEAISTRKALERTPFERFEWQPHEKSLSLGKLASHIADIPAWMSVTVPLDEWNVDTSGRPTFAADSTDSLVTTFDKNVAEAKAILSDASDETLLGNWKMIMGGNVFLDMPKIAVVRTWVLNHLIHHRGQLTVYLRENDIAVPGIYGGSADEVA